MLTDLMGSDGRAVYAKGHGAAKMRLDVEPHRNDVPRLRAARGADPAPGGSPPGSMAPAERGIDAAPRGLHRFLTLRSPLTSVRRFSAGA